MVTTFFFIFKLFDESVSSNLFRYALVMDMRRDFDQNLDNFSVSNVPKQIRITEALGKRSKNKNIDLFRQLNFDYCSNLNANI